MYGVWLFSHNFAKFKWVPEFVEFVLDSFSCFNITTGGNAFAVVKSFEYKLPFLPTLYKLWKTRCELKETGSLGTTKN